MTAHAEMGHVDLWRGRLDDARRDFLAAEGLAGEVSPSFQHGEKVGTAILEAMIGDPAWAETHLRSTMSSGAVDDLDPSLRDWVQPVLSFVLLGRIEDAERLMDEWGPHVTPIDRLDYRRLQITLDAWNGAAGDPLARLQALRAEVGCADDCWPAWKVILAEASGDPSAAAKAHQAMWDRGHANLPLNSSFRLRAALRLGPLYEQAGDTARALEAYRRIVELWADGDARAQATVDEARRRVAMLGG